MTRLRHADSPTTLPVSAATAAGSQSPVTQAALPARIRVARVAGPGTAESGELYALLLRRLRIFSSVMAAGLALLIVMEYLPGPTLDELVRRHGPVPPARAIYFLRQVCAALREAHAIGLIHRDIKPGNVIVCERGGEDDVIKLLDFGLVLPPIGDDDHQKLTRDGTIAGTPAYMSPEQASEDQNLDARSDIYSVGALAYFLLTGEPPFVRHSAVQTLAAHIYEDPAPPTKNRSEVPADLEAVVLRCLAKNPADRYPDTESLDQALADCRTCGSWTAIEAAAWWRSLT